MERNRGGARILVVDDDEAVRESTADILQTAGYVVHQAADVDDALHELAIDDVQLLILDLGLTTHLGGEPGSTGLDLLDQVPEPPPVILVSGSGIPPAADPRLGAFLPKPVAPRRLLDEVERLLSR